MRKEKTIQIIALFIIELMIFLPVAFSASAAQTTNQTAGNVTQPLISLDVTLPSYSRQKSITVEGTTASGAKIEYYIGPTKVKVGRARPDGTFKTVGVPLIKKGDNNLMVKAIVDGQSAQKTFTIKFDPAPPVLNVSDVPGFTTSKTVKVKGDVSEPSTIKYTVYTKKDDIAPGTVPGLEVREVKKNQVTLVWDISPENDFYEYAVYRDGKRIGVARTPVFIDTGVASDVEYSYQVSAVDSSCNEGPKSAPKKATTEKGGETEEKETIVQLSCAPVYNTMQTAVPFELTFNLEAGKNIIEIIAEDAAGNVARVEKGVVLDIGPPQFVTTNLDQLGTTYIPDVTIKGNLSEKGTVFVYLNDESKPSHFELTDDNGHFEIPVKLKQDVKIETGTAAELDTGIGWKNKIKLKAVDLAGQEAWYPGQQKNAEVTWALCGYGSWFDFDPETITPSMLTPRLLMQGIQQIGIPFTLKYIGGQQGVEINGLVNAVPVRLNPEMAEFFDNDKIVIKPPYLNKRPGTTDTWDGYVMINFAPWPVDSLDLEGNTTPAAIEEAISSWRRGEEPKVGAGFAGINPYFIPGCPSYPVLGCAKLYLEIDIPIKEKVSIVDQKTGKERIEYKTSRQRNCLPITIDIDQVIPPDVIRKDSLEATSHFFSQAIELIDEVLDPLTTFTENVVYLCMGGAAALFLAGLLKRFFCSNLLLKAKGVDKDIAQAGLCDIAYAGDESAKSRCGKCEWLTKTYNNVLQDVYQPVCDRIGCPSAPTVQKYIMEKKGTPKDITMKLSDKPAAEGERSPRQKAIDEWGVFGKVYSGSGCGFSGASKRVPDVISPTYAVEKVKGAVHIRGRSREGERCSSDDGCDPGLYCNKFSGTCMVKKEEVIPLHSVQAGGECTKDEECIGGMICDVFNKCSEKPKDIAKGSVGEGGYCEEDDHCVEGLKCDTMFKSECYDPDKIPEIEPGSVAAGGECYKKEDCNEGLECSEEFGTCYDPLAKTFGSVGPGGGCDKDADCALDLTCQKGKCTSEQECKKDTDCPTHQWCHEDGYCFTPSRQGQWCANDDYCEAEFKCKDNVCVYAAEAEEIKPGTRAVGETCDKNEDCKTELKCDMFNGVCYKPSETPVLAGKGEICGSDSDCDLIDPNKPWLGNMQCNKFKHLCFVPSGLNQQCGSNTDCEYGWVCEGGKCVAKECQKDADCPQGYFCDQTSKFCYYARGEGDRCITDDVCELGLACVDGYCKYVTAEAPKKVGEACDVNGDCQVGLICHSLNKVCQAPVQKGGSCGLDDDCAGFMVCFSTTNKCAERAKLAEPCGVSDDCAAGLSCHLRDRTCFVPVKEGFSCSYQEDCAYGLSCHPTKDRCFNICSENADCTGVYKQCVDGYCMNPYTPTGTAIYDVLGAFSTGAAVASGIGGSTASAEETTTSKIDDPYVCGFNLKTEFGLPDKVGLKDLYEIYLEEDAYAEIAKKCRNSSLHPACPLCCGIDYMWQWNSACGVGNFLGISNQVLDIDTFDELKNSVKLAAEKVGKGDEVGGFNLWNMLSGFCSAEGNPTPEVVRTGLNFNPKISEAEDNMMQVFVFPNPSTGGESFKYTIFRGYLAKTYKIEGAAKDGRKTYREDEMYQFSSTITAIKDLELTQYFKDLGTPKETSQFNAFKSAFCKNVGKSKLEGKKDCSVVAKEVWESVKKHVGYVDQEYIIKPNSGIINSIRCICLPAIISYLKKWRQISVAIKNCVDMIRLTGDGSEGYCRSMLSTYVCDLLWEVISCFVNKWSSPSGKRVSVASGIADLMGVVTGAGKDVSNEVEGRYGDSAAFNAMFNEKQLVHGLCMMAFGFEWNVDIAAMAQQSVESVPVETIVLGPMPCERRFLSWNPEPMNNVRGLTTWEYHFGLMAAAGADINTRMKLKCSTGFGCSEADGFAGGECDCNKVGEEKVVTVNPVCKPAWKSRVNKDELLNVDCSYVAQQEKYRFDTLIFEYDWENPTTKQRETKKSECRLIQFGSDPPAFCKFDIFSNSFRCQFGEAVSGIKIEKAEPKYENAIKEGKFKGKQVFALDEDLKFQLSIKQMMPESPEEQDAGIKFLGYKIVNSKGTVVKELDPNIDAFDIQLKTEGTYKEDVEIIDAAGWRNYFAKTASSGDRYNFEIWASGETALKLKIEENLDNYLGDVDIQYTEDGTPAVPTQKFVIEKTGDGRVGVYIPKAKETQFATRYASGQWVTEKENLVGQEQEAVIGKKYTYVYDVPKTKDTDKNKRYTISFVLKSFDQIDKKHIQYTVSYNPQAVSMDPCHTGDPVTWQVTFTSYDADKYGRVTSQVSVDPQTGEEQKKTIPFQMACKTKSDLAEQEKLKDQILGAFWYNEKTEKDVDAEPPATLLPDEYGFVVITVGEGTVTVTEKNKALPGGTMIPADEDLKKELEEEGTQVYYSNYKFSDPDIGKQYELEVTYKNKDGIEIDKKTFKVRIGEVSGINLAALGDIDLVPQSSVHVPEGKQMFKIGTSSDITRVRVSPQKGLGFDIPSMQELTVPIPTLTFIPSFIEIGFQNEVDLTKDEYHTITVDAFAGDDIVDRKEYSFSVVSREELGLPVLPADIKDVDLMVGGSITKTALKKQKDNEYTFYIDEVDQLHELKVEISDDIKNFKVDGEKVRASPPYSYAQSAQGKDLIGKDFTISVLDENDKVLGTIFVKYLSKGLITSVTLGDKTLIEEDYVLVPTGERELRVNLDRGAEEVYLQGYFGLDPVYQKLSKISPTLFSVKEDITKIPSAPAVRQEGSITLDVYEKALPPIPDDPTLNITIPPPQDKKIYYFEVFDCAVMNKCEDYSRRKLCLDDPCAATFDDPDAQCAWSAGSTKYGEGKCFPLKIGVLPSIQGGASEVIEEAKLIPPYGKYLPTTGLYKGVVPTVYSEIKYTLELKLRRMPKKVTCSLTEDGKNLGTAEIPRKIASMEDIYTKKYTFLPGKSYAFTCMIDDGPATAQTYSFLATDKLKDVSDFGQRMEGDDVVFIFTDFRDCVTKLTSAYSTAVAKDTCPYLYELGFSSIEKCANELKSVWSIQDSKDICPGLFTFPDYNTCYLALYRVWQDPVWAAKICRAKHP